MATFDIFSGTTEQGSVWVCAVDGLEAAKFLMQKLAVEKSGPYFLYSTEMNQVIDRVNAPGPRPETTSKAKTSAA